MSLKTVALKLSALFILLLAAQPLLSQWQGMRLTQNAVRNSTGARSLLVDGGNTQHATWSESHPSGLARVYYSQKPCELPWTSPEIVSDTSASASLATLALNPGGADVVLTWFLTNDIYAVMGVPGSWTQIQITNSFNNDQYPTAAVDNAGKLHFAWTSGDSNSDWRIHYANNRSGSFVEQRIAVSSPGPFGGGAAPKISLDPNGAPSITYRQGNFQMYRVERLWLTHPDSTNWQREYLSAPTAEEFIGDHVFDAAGNIHAAISGNDGFGFPINTYYLQRPAGGMWTTAVPVDLAENAEFASLSLDANDAPQIGLSGLSGNIYTGSAYHAFYNGTVWLNDTIHLYTGGKYAVNPNVALDDQGNANALCYLDDGVSLDSVEVYHFRTGDCQGGANGTGTQLQSGLAVYPNPSSGEVRLLLPSTEEVHGIILIGMDGRVVWEKEFDPGTTDHLQFQLDDVANGVYLVEARTSTGTFRSRLVLEDR